MRYNNKASVNKQGSRKKTKYFFGKRRGNGAHLLFVGDKELKA